jgi:hypothetical protein
MSSTSEEASNEADRLHPQGYHREQRQIANVNPGLSLQRDCGPLCPCLTDQPKHLEMSPDSHQTGVALRSRRVWAEIPGRGTIVRCNGSWSSLHGE